jgi:phosphoribosylaminoimidazole-succinocarboxamide synthase
MPATLSTSIPGLGAPRVGKVREVYDLGSRLLIVATDRISAFDVVMANGIPDKGRILNQMSAFWFNMFSSLCPNHVISVETAEIEGELKQLIGSEFNSREFDLQGRAMLAEKTEPLPIECVARGYITGSLYKDYLQHGPGVHGLRLPKGLVESSRLENALFTPATKAVEGHDENLDELTARELVGIEIYNQARNWTLDIYRRAALFAHSKGILLADTKFEFGLKDGQLIWIDEALTPDSSRFWPVRTYKPGQQQPSFDKQFVRNYLESINWNKQPPGPTLPEEVVEQTRAKYLEAFTLLTGRQLEA